MTEGRGEGLFGGREGGGTSWPSEAFLSPAIVHVIRSSGRPKLAAASSALRGRIHIMWVLYNII